MKRERAEMSFAILPKAVIKHTFRSSTSAVPGNRGYELCDFYKLTESEIGDNERRIDAI